MKEHKCLLDYVPILMKMVMMMVMTILPSGWDRKGSCREPCVVRIECGLEKGKVAGRSVLV